MRRICCCLLPLLLASAARAGGDLEERVPAEPGGRLVIELPAGSVAVEGDEAHELRIDARSSGFAGDSVRFRLEEDDREWRLSAELEGFWGVLTAPRIRVHVRVPRQFSVEVETGGGQVSLEELEGSVQAVTRGGSLEASRIVGPVELETSGGRIRVDEIQGALRARTSGGSITVTEASGPLEVETSGGSLDLRDVGGPVEGRTSGGSIRVRFAGAPGGSLETSGGHIEVELPERAGVELEAETLGGRVRLPRALELRGEVTPGRVRGALGGGGDSLRLRTSSGHIDVRGR